MLEAPMYCLIMFTCNGLLVYWATRTAMLLNGPEKRTEQTLEKDLVERPTDSDRHPALTHASRESGRVTRRAAS